CNPSAWACSRVSTPSSQATTWAPPAARAAAVARPERPRPSTAMVWFSTPWTGIMLVSLAVAARGRFAPRTPREYLQNGESLSAQLQGGKPDQRQDQRDDPEADDDLRLAPALFLEMVVDRGHQEDPLAGALEVEHLDDDAERLDHEKAADDGQDDLVLGDDGDGAQRAAQRQAAGV